MEWPGYNISCSKSILPLPGHTHTHTQKKKKKKERTGKKVPTEKPCNGIHNPMKVPSPLTEKIQRYEEDKNNDGNRNEIKKMSQNSLEACQ